MVQIIQENRRPSFGQRFSQAIGSGLEMGNQMMEKHKQDVMNKQSIEAGKQLLGMDLSGFDPETRKALLVEGLKQHGKGQRSEITRNYLDRLYPQRHPPESNQKVDESSELPNQKRFETAQIPDEIIAQIGVENPAEANILQHQKDVALREKRESETEERKKFESERTYHTQFSKGAEEKANNLRHSLPKQEMAMDFARSAIESGETGAFTMNHLADIFGLDSLRNAKGAQLILASKEQLIPNLGRISAKAQNQYMEKRMASMIPQIGAKDEANLTMQEMLEAESLIDRSYLNEFDRLTEEDMKNYGFVKKDVEKRARDSVNSLEKEIGKRTSYRMKEIEENANGLSELKRTVGKNVIKGTPLTLAMAKLYKDKFGDNALKVAEKNGYYIPTLEEFRIFQQRPAEFREEL